MHGVVVFNARAIAVLQSSRRTPAPSAVSASISVLKIRRLAAHVDDSRLNGFHVQQRLVMCSVAHVLRGRRSYGVCCEGGDPRRDGLVSSAW